jgi:hypothetical protein
MVKLQAEKLDFAGRVAVRGVARKCTQTIGTMQLLSGYPPASASQKPQNDWAAISQPDSQPPFHDCA